MSRHETINGRLKKWTVLNSSFRHAVHFLQIFCFYAVLNLAQVRIDLDEVLFQIDIDD
jgi:hypothetical protein